ncbi:MAG: DUF192 domain-containing protein [Rhizobiaceae bacterium]|jgi:hypothetical protein|nr:DUF192 domain-containing protein [Rhizobiaceae bacterium]
MLERALRIGLLALAGLVLALTTAFANDEPMRLDVDEAPLIIRSAQGDTRLGVEIADTPEERARGLMFRSDLPRDRAMLFDFQQDRAVAMWMKNTPLPLDMIFAGADGVISKVIVGTTPFSEAVLASDGPVRYVVEVNAGVAAEIGATVGARLVHPLIAAP